VSVGVESRPAWTQIIEGTVWMRGGMTMKRREFLKTGMAATGGVLAAETLLVGSHMRLPTRRFRLNYAPHFGMFQHLAGHDPLDQLKFAADQGFTAWEDRLITTRPVELQHRIARTMDAMGMQMGVVAVCEQPGDRLGAPSGMNSLDNVLRDVACTVDVAKRVNARWVTIDLERFSQRQFPAAANRHEQSKTCVQTLARCVRFLESHGLVLLLTPTDWMSDRLGNSGDELSRIREVCATIDSPSCKLLFDLYRQHKAGEDVLSRIDSSWPLIAYFQCGDSQGRKEPGTGDIDYPRIFRHLSSRGFTGVVGMEHGNSLPGRAGDQAVIDAYVRADRCERLS
jgi:hydroxypyruvate isomerase